MKKFLNNKQTLIIIAIVFLHLLVTFYTDKFIFIVSPLTNLSDYIICKILLSILLFFLYRTLYRAFFDKSRKGSPEYQIIKYALFYLIPVILILVIKLPQGFLSNDENLIFESAVNLQHYTWFYYITTYYYIVSLMLIPSWIGPIIIKVLIQVIVVGYVTYRLIKFIGVKYGKFAYLLFLMYPVIAYTTSAHRLPIYFLLYLVLISTLLFDSLEHVSLTKTRSFWLLFLCAVLTQWRTEGIYLVVLIPLLLFLVYKNIRSKKAAFTILLGALLLQYIISIPQNGLFASEMGAAADDRMKPFYAYTITNMYRNGLDYETNKEDLDIVDQYLSLAMIQSINEYYGDINYEDVLILYKEGFVGVRPEATVSEFFDYAAAIKRICLHNPDVLFRTRWGAFCYAAQPYHITFEGFGIKSLAHLGISIIKTIAYNLFIPCMIIIALFIYSLIKKRWFTFFVSGGLMIHWFIVFLLAPASYFKYYFPIYIIAYFYLLLFILQKLYNYRNKERTINFLS